MSPEPLITFNGPKQATLQVSSPQSTNVKRVLLRHMVINETLYPMRQSTQGRQAIERLRYVSFVERFDCLGPVMIDLLSLLIASSRYPTTSPALDDVFLCPNKHSTVLSFSTSKVRICCNIITQWVLGISHAFPFGISNVDSAADANPVHALIGKGKSCMREHFFLENPGA